MRDRKWFYMYVYICMYVCGVIISVRRELNFERACDLRDNSAGLYSVGKEWKGEYCTTLASFRLRSTINMTGSIVLADSTSLTMKVTAWRLFPSGPGYRYILGLMMVMAACRLLNIV